jgi:cytochrome c-type biogenesis protein CcmH
MPLAILRFAASELPRSFDLNDQQAMSAQMSISQFKEFNVLARVSKTGQAIPQPGDLIGEISHVQLGAKNLNLVIDRVQP